MHVNVHSTEQSVSVSVYKIYMDGGVLGTIVVDHVSSACRVGAPVMPSPE
jgi:hypothetical protein